VKVPRIAKFVLQMIHKIITLTTIKRRNLFCLYLQTSIQNLSIYENKEASKILEDLNFGSKMISPLWIVKIHAYLESILLKKLS
jgi:hypothetical protein